MGVDADADAAGAGNLVLWASLFRYGWVFCGFIWDVYTRWLSLRVIGGWDGHGALGGSIP